MLTLFLLYSLVGVRSNTQRFRRSQVNLRAAQTGVQDPRDEKQGFAVWNHKLQNLVDWQVCLHSQRPRYPCAHPDVLCLLTFVGVSPLLPFIFSCFPLFFSCVYLQ